MMPGTDEGQVAASDIAEMAGVSRAAVSNWRKRSADFPQAIAGSEAKPLFNRADVLTWLNGRGHKVKPDAGKTLVWSMLNQLRGEFPVEDMGPLLMSILCLRRLCEETPAGQAQWTRLRSASPHEGFDLINRITAEGAAGDSRWLELVDLTGWLRPNHTPTFFARTLYEVIAAVAGVASEALATVGDHVLSRISASQVRSAGEYGLVGSRVSQLLAAAVGAVEGVLYDPACGIAEALIEVWAHRANAGQVMGSDVNAYAIQLARQRCFLHGIPTTFVRADVLGHDPDPDLRADVVVVEPPFGSHWDAQRNLADSRWVFGTPPGSSSETAWMQHAIAHLAAGGRAFVVTSMGPLFRGGAEQAIRSELLRQSCVETVIGLTGKMLPHTSIPLALWVLRRPGESKTPDSVLLIDASEIPDPQNHVHAWLNSDVDVHDGPPRALVAIRDLVAAETILPQRWTNRPDTDVQEIANRYRDVQASVSAAASDLNSVHSTLELDFSRSMPRVLTVKELIRINSANLAQGRPRKDEARNLESSGQVVTAGNVRDGLPTPRPDISWSSVDMEIRLADEVTQPGDILVTTTNRIRAVVDEQGGRVLDKGVYRLRVDLGQCEPGYIAYCLTGEWNTRFRVGTAVQRSDVKDLEIPLVPLEEQRRILAVLQQANDLVRRAQALTEAANALVPALLDLVRYNVSGESALGSLAGMSVV